MPITTHPSDSQRDGILRRMGMEIPSVPEERDFRTAERPRCPRCRGATYVDSDLTLWHWHCRMCGWEGPDYLRPARFVPVVHR